MPTARRSRTIAASEQELWEVIHDPHHLPRWWPRVTRVEDVQDGEFTEVMKTSKGKLVRADFKLLASEEARHTVSWEQRVEGTPFARLLRSAQTEVRLEPVAGAGGESEEGGGELPSEGAARARVEVAELTPEAPSRGEVAGLTPGALSRARATRVTIEVRQTLTGFFPRFGGYMVRRAAGETIEEALDGLERISG